MSCLEAVVVLILALAFTVQSARGVLHSGKSPKLYIIGDIHFDPFYKTSKAVGPCTNESSASRFSRVECDTPMALLDSAIGDVASQYASDGEGILLITGDTVRHKMKVFKDNSTVDPHEKEYELVGTITSTVQGIINKYMSALGTTHERARELVVPHPSIMATLGNEDCIPDYHFDSTKSVHPALARYTSALVNSSVISVEEAAQLSKCGFYSRVIPGTALRVIALNSILYSDKHKPANQSTIPDPCGQFVWLQQELSTARAAGEAVHIVGHVIPFTSKWHQQYIDTYRGIVKDFHDVIRVQWFGHTHMFSFITLSHTKAPLLFDVPAISPIDGQRPSYLRVSTATYGGNEWSVDEIHIRYLNSVTNTWTDGYQFCDTFGLEKPLTTEALYSFGKSLISHSHSSNTWLAFERLHFGMETGSNTLSKKDKLKLCCHMISWTDDDYSQCKAANKMFNISA